MAAGGSPLLAGHAGLLRDEKSLVRRVERPPGRALRPHAIALESWEQTGRPESEKQQEEPAHGGRAQNSICRPYRNAGAEQTAGGGRGRSPAESEMPLTPLRTPRSPRAARQRCTSTASAPLPPLKTGQLAFALPPLRPSRLFDLHFRTRTNRDYGK